MRTYLSVSFEEKEQAKSLGAKWDPRRKKWYAPNGEQHLIERWPLHDKLMDKLIGEDRTFGGNQLFVDLVPRSCWFTNVRKCVHSSDWDRLRHFVYQRANNQCECCAAKSTLDAHERWYFNEEIKTQKLMRIIALCKLCHESTHMGLAQIKGRGEAATRHLMQVTGMNWREANQHIQKAFDLWHERNRFEWILDLSIIIDSGIKLAQQFNKTTRKAIAENETLRIRKIESESKDSYVEQLFNNSTREGIYDPEPNQEQILLNSQDTVDKAIKNENTDDISRETKNKSRLPQSLLRSFFLRIRNLLGR